MLGMDLQNDLFKNHVQELKIGLINLLPEAPSPSSFTQWRPISLMGEYTSTQLDIENAYNNVNRSFVR